MYFSGPSKEQIARNKQIKDSIELVQKKQEVIEAAKLAAIPQATPDTLKQTQSLSDSAKAALLTDNYRDFAVATNGKPETFVIENENVKATISNKGGQIEKVELKNYHRSGKTENLVLFDKDSTNFSLKLNAYDRSRIFSTDSFYFKSVKQSASSIILQLQTAKAGSYIEYSYSLKPDDYVVDSEIRFVGMQNIISQTEDQLQLNWSMLYPSQEEYIVKEKKAATVYFKQAINSPDYINPIKDEEKEISEADVKWVCFKQQFFNSTIIADNVFNKAGSFIKVSSRPESPTIVKAVKTELGIPYAHTPNEKFSYKFSFKNHC